ncbi:hypothetical protein [Brevundimonas sp. LM2]|nr:hypothetical protein [Brevundimonas sp. LM2]
MTAPPATVQPASPPVGPRRPSLMSYGVFILVGCCLCASLVASLL